MPELGDADASVATVGGVLIVAVAPPLTEPAVAVMCAGPPEAGAWNRPVLSIEPISVVQVMAGWLDIAKPNWSLATAVNCCVWFALTVTLPGVPATSVNA